MNSILTVVTPADTNDLATLGNLKTLLGISGDKEDARLRILISQASGILAEKCNIREAISSDGSIITRGFGQETLSEQYPVQWHRSCHTHHANTHPLILSRYPIVSISSVTENDVLLVAADYQINRSNGLLFRLSSGNVCHWPHYNVVVEYVAGFALIDGLPNSVERACIDLVNHLRGYGARDPSIKSEQINIPGVRDKRIEYWVGPIGEDASLPPSVAALICEYRRPNIA